MVDIKIKYYREGGVIKKKPRGEELDKLTSILSKNIFFFSFL
jgi:hypothetical protein